MVVITLVGELLAKENNDFVYRGPLSECRECKLKTVCFNLESGHRYRVTAVRNVHHECRIHEEGVRVVEVENIGIPAAVMSKLAVDGTVFSLESQNCSNIYCGNYRLCHPFGVISGAKYHISSVAETIECDEGRSLKKVTLL